MKAAMRSGHAEVTFAAAVIRLNGTGSPAVDDRGPRAAARLFLRAASSGHIGALRDLGFCVSNGLGVPPDPAAGRRLTIWANVQELRDRYPEPGPERDAALAHVGSAPGCLSTGFGCFAAAPRRLEWAHPANRFLGEWFAARPPAPRLRLLCSLPTCGRPETRRLEFRRCTACGVSRYCSRACQAAGALEDGAPGGVRPRAPVAPGRHGQPGRRPCRRRACCCCCAWQRRRLSYLEEQSYTIWVIIFYCLSVPVMVICGLLLNYLLILWLCLNIYVYPPCPKGSN
jgi:hypothetical protein